jgi:tetratricopeptide (TPR) repeat protein
MLAFSSMFMGRYQPAIDAARKGLLTVDPELLRSIPNYIEAFFTLPYHILIRFGKWKEILAEPFPKEPDVYLCTTATLHYARGIALAATGDTKGARAEQKLLIESYDQIPDMRYLHNCKMRDILAIGKHMLEGEILYREERCKEAFAELRIAVDLEDHLNFDEPWGWMQPVRHALGALLLEQGHAEEAEQVYLADLKRYPDNIWSLKGLTEIYVKTNPDAAKTRLDTIEQLKRLTDHEIEVSCYCRLTREQ